MTLDEAQQLEHVWQRPSYLQRHPGPGAPIRAIVGVGRQGPLGTWVLLECRHWREIVHYEIMPALGRKRPTKARCGLCRDEIEP